MGWLIRFIQQVGIAVCVAVALVLLYVQREGYTFNTIFQLVPVLVIAFGLYILSQRRKEVDDQEREVSEQTITAIRVGAGTVIRLCNFRTRQLLYGKVFVQPHEVRVRVSETHEVRCLVDTLQVSITASRIRSRSIRSANARDRRLSDCYRRQSHNSPDNSTGSWTVRARARRALHFLPTYNIYIYSFVSPPCIILLFNL